MNTVLQRAKGAVSIAAWDNAPKFVIRERLSAEGAIDVSILSRGFSADHNMHTNPGRCPRLKMISGRWA
jgi:hypothetical protein